MMQLLADFNFEFCRWILWILKCAVVDLVIWEFS